MVTPEEIQPFPKASARKIGRTHILTDTPEKEEIRRQKEKKTVKKTKSERNPKKKNVARKISESKSEDEDEDAKMNEIRDQEQFEAPGLEIGDYVLIQFLQKKGKPKHFVGKIFSRNSSYKDFQIQFFKRIG
jgi:hypothetical protein